MDKLKQQQSIRLMNTLLAAAGAGMLSLTLIYAYYAKALLVSSQYLWGYLTIFWLGNFAIIGVVAKGWNLRFRDPALSLQQMYWAVSASIVGLLFSSRVDIAIYLLMLLTLVFGIFRVSLRDFNIISIFVIVSIFIMHCVRLFLLERHAAYSLVLVQWMTFAFCALALTHLCRSILTLRNRLREKNEQLLHALETKQQFLANMSHEIRTPMNGVLGMLDILLRDEVSTKQRRYLSVAHSSATSLLVVINDVLDFSRMEAGKLHIEPIPFDLGDLSVEVMASLSANAESRGLELVLDLSPNIADWTIITDPVRVRQILTNLLGNALKFTQEGDVVLSASIDVVGDEHRLCIDIQDTGIGIDSSKIPLLFESFTQSDPSTTRIYGGTGLGLAICKHLCQLMGGNITATSALGEGSKFSFWLPIRLSDKIRTVAEDFRQQIENKKILLVDQHPSSLQVFQKQLDAMGAIVTPVNSAADALAVLEMQHSHPFDLVVLDLPLDDMEGCQLARAIRDLPDKKNLAILVLTSALNQLHDEDLISVGMTLNTYKPILPLRFYKAIIDAMASASNSKNIVPVTDAASLIDQSAFTKSERKLRALLVEDNITNQEVAAFLLDELGYEIDVANNGQEAVVAVENSLTSQTQYDVILMDCQMPVMDGYEAAKRIRDLPNISNFRVPIIAMTANVMPGDREKCLAAGMDDYVSKPILFDVVEKKLAHWVVTLNNKSAPQVTALTSVEESPTSATNVSAPLCWDMDYLRKLVRGKEERMVHLLTPFIASLDSSANEILVELNNRNIEKSAKLLHSLRGASANLGARALPDLLQEMEAMLREGDIDSTVTCAQENLSEITAKLKSEVTEFLDARKSASDGAQ